MPLSDSTRSRRGWVVPAALVAVASAVYLTFFYTFGGWSLREEADLTLCNGDEPQSLDPAIVTGQLEGRIDLALFEGLTTRNPAGDVIPGMAEKWEISPDGLTYTFHLRPGIKWSNGDPITSADFINSWERTLRPVTGSQYAYQLYYLVNAEAYGTGKITDFAQVGVKAPDPQTLVVTLVHPTAYFLELTSFQTLCPVHMASVNKWGNEWTKPGHMISNGPYMLKEWRLNDYLMLEANPYYWRPVRVHRLKILPTSNATACFNLFTSGKSDLIIDTRSIPAELVQDIKDQPYFHANPFGATSFMRYNVKRKPFDDLRVRKALALATNKEDIVTKITRAGEIPADTLVPPGNKDYIPPEGLKCNIAEAQRLLAEAGYPGGRGFPDVQMLYAKRGSGEKVAAELQELWKRDLGITVRLRAQEWKVYLSTQETMDYDLSLSAWIGDYNDPQTFIDMFVTDGGNNMTGWGNKQYDDLLTRSENEPDPAKRMAMLRDMEKILVVDEVPIFPIYFWVGMALYQPEKIGGFAPNFVDDHRWGEFYIPREEAMIALIIRRLIQSIPVLLVVLSLTFLIVRIAPGNPFSNGKAIRKDIMVEIEKRYDLHGSLGHQYSQYLWKVVHGDFGLSTQYLDRTVNEIIAQTLPVSITLGSLAYALALAVGIPLGAWAAIHHDNWRDRALMLVALLGISIPTFVSAPLLIMWLALKWHLLPSYGWGSLSQIPLPAFCLSLPFTATIARLTRGSLLEVLKLDFVRTARAKGLPENIVLFRHALKVAILPIIGYSGPAAAGILTGSLVIETLFGIPGIGQFFVNSALNHDPFVTTGVVLVFSLFLIVFNLLADIAYFVVDRRVKFE